MCLLEWFDIEGLEQVGTRSHNPDRRYEGDGTLGS